MVDLARDMAGSQAAGAFPGGFWPGAPGVDGGLNGDLIAAQVLGIAFDVTELPINAAALIQWSWVAFGTGAGTPGVNTQTAGIVVAFRTADGALQVDPNAWASIACSVPLDPLAGVGAIYAADNDTVVLPITNGAGPTRITVKWSIAFVLAGVPLG